MPSLTLSRRRFLSGLATTAATVAAAGCSRSVVPLAFDVSATAMPSPEASGIEHVIVVMMENRSFDHALGWLPGANGRQSGLTYLDKRGVAHATHHLSDNQNCSLGDPDHSYAGGRVQYNGGACDGWLRADTDDVFPIGFYTAKDLSFLGQAATNWTVCDNYFAALLAPTYPNRFYQHAAQTDRLENTTVVSTLPTIWDSLAAAGLQGRYFYSDTPFTAMWGSKYRGISHGFADFLTLCKQGSLPQVSFVDPRFEDEEGGTSNDDHPHADIRNGEAFLNQVYTAVTQSPAWSKTVMIVNFDEWGGFFDHVPPPLAPVPASDAAAGSDGRLGFRVPALVISPFARRGYVSRTQFDHTSVLKLIEWRWGLAPLSVRDDGAGNLAETLDFANANVSAPQFNVPVGPFGGSCSATVNAPVAAIDDEDTEWSSVRTIARKYGFTVY